MVTSRQSWQLMMIGVGCRLLIVSFEERLTDGKPSPENAARPIEDRRRESLELCGELTEFYNRLASIFEYEGRFPRAEAQRMAMIETRETELYRRWLALG